MFLASDTDYQLLVITRSPTKTVKLEHKINQIAKKHL